MTVMPVRSRRRRHAHECLGRNLSHVCHPLVGDDRHWHDPDDRQGARGRPMTETAPHPVGPILRSVYDHWLDSHGTGATRAAWDKVARERYGVMPVDSARDENGSRNS